MDNSQKQLRGFWELALDILCLVDFDNRFQDVNPAFEKVLGYTKEEVLGKPFSDYLHPNDLATWLSEAKLHIASHIAHEFQNRFRCKDGSYRWLSWNSVPALDERLIYAFARDITESKKAERKLKEQAFISANINDAIIGTDSRYRINYWNEVAKKMYGYRAEEILGQFAGILKPEFIGMTSQEALNQLERTGKLKVELTHTTKDGCRIVVESSNNLISDENGKPYSVISINRDITELKKAEKELKESEYRFRRIVETANEGIWLAMPGGKTTFVNQKMADMLGYAREEIVGREGLEFLLESFRNHVPADRKRLDTGEKIQGQYGFRRKNGSELWTIGSTSPLLDNNGKHVANLAMHTDITDRKNAENELMRARNQLRKYSSYLQEQIENERKRLATEIHDELGQMLTSLKIDISMLIKKLPENNAVVTEKARNILNLANDTDKLLKKISSELRPPILDQLGLAAAVEWQAEQFRKRTGIKCVLQIVPVSLEIDKKRASDIFRIIQESLTNVARHSGATQVKISLRKQARILKLVIQDNGHGITSSEKSNPQSFGLMGMKERAVRWGGTLKITASKPHGTSIILKIPLKKDILGAFKAKNNRREILI
jgi:PAS domain S-box-containing protein